MTFGYARVSTAKQDLTRQINALKEFGCDNIFSDVQSGKNMDRPNLRKLLSMTRECDTFVVTDIDRLGRNFREVTELYRELMERRINIKVINQSLLDSNVDDKKDEIINVVVVPLLIYLAERERMTLIERINDGISNLPVDEEGYKYSRKTGNRVGRPAKDMKLSREDTEMLRRVRKGEVSVKGFCRYMNISRQTYYKYYKSYIIPSV